MTAYPKMTAEERKAEYAEVTREYEELKACLLYTSGRVR